MCGELPKLRRSEVLQVNKQSLFGFEGAGIFIRRMKRRNWFRHLRHVVRVALDLYN